MRRDLRFARHWIVQISTKNSVELVEHPGDVVNDLAARLGLRPVGWIFTDLIPLDTSTGTVKHFRGNVNSHFLSAEECIMAAELQSKHPNACHLSPDGHFGSKFVTVVVAGCMACIVIMIVVVFIILVSCTCV